MKCTKVHNVQAASLCCSASLLFCNVAVTIAVVICIRSLMCVDGRSHEKTKLGGLDLALYSHMLSGAPLSNQSCM